MHLRGEEAGLKAAPRILVIPDLQAKPDVPLEHLTWAGKYAAEKRPDAIVQLGDWYDMHSLSIYSRGKLTGEGGRYEDDIAAGDRALELFGRELKRGRRSWRPRLDITLGNHEDRILRAVEDQPSLEGKMSSTDFGFQRHGWNVHGFLRPINVMGITFLHYCPLNAQGRVSASRFGAPSALAQARRMMRSTVCGHRQGLDTAVVHTPGKTVRGVIAGSFYQHQESYLTACGDTYWRGVLMLNDVRDGSFDLCEVSMDYLRRRYS